jgi:hypothetical protein
VSSRSPLRRGWAVADNPEVIRTDLSPYVYAVPVALASLALAAFRLRAGWKAPRRRQASPLAGLVVCVPVLLFAGWMYVAASGDLNRYNADASCAPGFASEGIQHGDCRIEDMRIIRSYWSRGRSRNPHLVLALEDGSSADVSYARSRYGNVWRGVTHGDDRTGYVQFFRTDIVAVETQAGMVDTAKMPTDRLNMWASVGLIVGAMGSLTSIMRFFQLPAA